MGSFKKDCEKFRFIRGTGFVQLRDQKEFEDLLDFERFKKFYKEYRQIEKKGDDPLYEEVRRRSYYWKLVKISLGIKLRHVSSSLMMSKLSEHARDRMMWEEQEAAKLPNELEDVVCLLYDRGCRLRLMSPFGHEDIYVPPCGKTHFDVAKKMWVNPVNEPDLLVEAFRKVIQVETRDFERERIELWQTIKRWENESGNKDWLTDNEMRGIGYFDDVFALKKRFEERRRREEKRDFRKESEAKEESMKMEMKFEMLIMTNSSEAKILEDDIKRMIAEDADRDSIALAISQLESLPNHTVFRGQPLLVPSSDLPIDPLFL